MTLSIDRHCLLIVDTVYWSLTLFIDCWHCLLIVYIVYWSLTLFIDCWHCLLIVDIVYWLLTLFIDFDLVYWSIWQLTLSIDRLIMYIIFIWDFFIVAIVILLLVMFPPLVLNLWCWVRFFWISNGIIMFVSYLCIFIKTPGLLFD